MARSNWSKIFKLYEAAGSENPESKGENWPPALKAASYDLKVDNVEIKTIMSALFQHRDDPQVDAKDRKIAGKILEKLQTLIHNKK